MIHNLLSLFASIKVVGGGGDGLGGGGGGNAPPHPFIMQNCVLKY